MALLGKLEHFSFYILCGRPVAAGFVVGLFNYL